MATHDNHAEVHDGPSVSLLANGNLRIILAVTILSVMGISSITPVLPTVGRELRISNEQIGIIIVAFSIPSMILAPIIGVLSDRFGRKIFIVAALFIFGIAGGLCAFTNNLSTLLVLRFIQGAASSALSTLNVTMIGDLFKDEQRTQALGYNVSAIAIGLAIFPVIGGSLAMIGWRYAFALPFVAVAVAIWALKGLDLQIQEKEGNMQEYLSASIKNIFSAKVLSIFIIGVITFIVLYGAFFTYFPILVESRFKSSSLVIGVIMGFMSTATVIIATQLSKLVQIFTESQLIRRGGILYGLGLLLIPFIPHLTLYILPLILIGIAHGINLPCIQSLLAKNSVDGNRAVLMSVNNMVFRVGQTFGPIIMGFIYGKFGVQFVFYVGSILCFFLFLSSYLVAKLNTQY